jgi:AcrR family transcriptional regulator
MPKGIPLTQDEIEERRREITVAAVDLILTQGFNETSMREIANAAGIGKSTLYDYFTNKDEIILFMVEDPLADLMDRARAIIQGDGSVAERLRGVMQMHLGFLLEKKAFYLKLSLEIQRLRLESQQNYQAKRYAYQDLIQALIEEGIQRGSFRPVNPAMAMKILISMMTPIVFTTRPTGTPEEMLTDGLNLFFDGLTAKY